MPDRPEIDTTDLEFEMELWNRPFDRDRFRDLIYRLIVELQLQGQIEHIKVSGAQRGRAELFRTGRDGWPSPGVCLDIYADERCMDERLLRHELGHEADRRNPAMQYDPAIEQRWAGDNAWALDMAANVSLDSRLGKRGLGKARRQKEFVEKFGADRLPEFQEAWANPPTTWLEIDALATRLSRLPSQPERPRSRDTRRRRGL